MKTIFRPKKLTESPKIDQTGAIPKRAWDSFYMTSNVRNKEPGEPVSNIHKIGLKLTKLAHGLLSENFPKNRIWASLYPSVIFEILKQKMKGFLHIHARTSKCTRRSVHKFGVGMVGGGGVGGTDTLYEGLIFFPLTTLIKHRRSLSSTTFKTIYESEA